MKPTDPADRRVIRVIEASLLFGLADRAVARAWRAAASSAVVALAVKFAAVRREVPAPQQRFTAGWALLVAVATHLALMLTGPVPPGWLWLLVPGILAAAGLLLVAASGDVIPKGGP